MEARFRDINVSGGKLSVLSIGEGPAVLFLHGWALDQRMWHKQYALAKHGLRVVTMDRRGFGASTAPPDINQELDDITRVLDALFLDQVALVGMSQGGRIALRYAMESADRLTHLALQGAPIDGFPTAPGGSEAVPIDAFRAFVGDGNKQAFLKEWLRHDLIRYDRALETEAIDELAQSYAGRDLLEGVPDHYSDNVFSKLGALTLPSLYIAGEHDTVWLKAVAVAFENLVPNGHSVFVPNAGHLCNISRPAFYNDILLDFLLP